MRVEQNNFRDMFSVYLSGPPQTQHVFCVSPTARVAHTGLAGEEWLEAFRCRLSSTVMVGMYVVLASGRVFIFPENPGTWCISSSCVSGRSRRIWFAA